MADLVTAVDELNRSISALASEIPDQVWFDVHAKVAAVLREHAVLRQTVRAVNANALAWHAGEEGKARALNVIAVWTSEALAGRLNRSVEYVNKAADAETTS